MRKRIGQESTRDERSRIVKPRGDPSERGAKSWNFAHQSAGCGQEALIRTSGSGRLYGFADN